MNTGSINTHLSNLEQLLEKGSGVVCKGEGAVQWPAVFLCAIPLWHALRGDQMFHILWKTVGCLGRYGFRVMGLTCDGAVQWPAVFLRAIPMWCTQRGPDVPHIMEDSWAPRAI